MMTTLHAEMREIAKIAQANFSHMVGNGFKVENYFPHTNLPLSEFSPFVLLDYNPPSYFPPLAKGKRGVGAHPHRGFETVTLVYEGKVAHRDSKGNSGVIGAGDVQWMTAASGILHEEFHEEAFSRAGGNFHVVQLWVNLPKKDKMSSPKYQTLLSSDMGRFEIDGKGSYLRVIAGQLRAASGPASTFSPIQLYDINLKKDADFSFALPKDHNSMLLVLKGSIQVNGQKAKFKDLVSFSHSGEEINLKASDESLVLVLSGEPINEPVIQSGPFVMNTEAEIEQANEDFLTGKFGRL